jgi:prephenate dehydrogenase
MNNLYVFGVGLIGGSFALAFKDAYPDAKVLGLDKDQDNLEEALRLGIIDEVSQIEDLKNAEMVFIAIPVDATKALLPEILDAINDDSIVIDAGSTKLSLCNAVRHHYRRRNYLAAHPIAGTEYSGPGAAIKNLFSGKTNIICEVEETAFKLQEKALQVFSNMGMRIRYMNPAAHDKHIAYVSHLSHISSFMLGKTVMEKEKNERDIFDMAGSGFESTVRLAKSSPEMWTPIFKQNRENVLETLEEYISNLKRFKELVAQEQFDEVYREMEETNHIGKILSGIHTH